MAKFTNTAINNLLKPLTIKAFRDKKMLKTFQQKTILIAKNVLLKGKKNRLTAV
jgi:hypothetical protein